MESIQIYLLSFAKGCKKEIAKTIEICYVQEVEWNWRIMEGVVGMRRNDTSLNIPFYMPPSLRNIMYYIPSK